MMRVLALIVYRQARRVNFTLEMLSIAVDGVLRRLRIVSCRAIHM